MRASVIVPALDEAAAIEAALAPLQRLRRDGHEIIVADGGSADATLARAAPLADRAFVAPRGRALQMNAGAAAASGEVLLFLHADSRLEADAVDAMLDAMAATRARWGRFDAAIEGRSRALPLVAAAMNLRSRITGIATGDQGIFVERALFGEAGGYPDQPLMEDVELSARLKRRAGAPLCLRTRIVTSGRRWDRQGALRTIVAMWRLRLAYRLGAEAATLARRYGEAYPREPQRPPVLQVFAKPPIPGAVKTRLAAAIGGERAAAVHAELVERTLATAVAARAAGTVGAVELWCASDAEDSHFLRWRNRYGVTLALQRDGSLGCRMEHALQAALVRGSPAILVGSDCPALDVGYIAAAAAALARRDAVFGPAEDGGYVLVGLSRPVAAFDAIEWGTPTVMAATRVRLAAAGASWSELPTRWDVDSASDLERWRREASAAPARAGAPASPHGATR